ncbi:FAD-binding domain-containing protein 21 [Elsinoe fawcettii]|nr:FAD-binding domain-containing protein 21 [Elsinoe fawcettii]
MRSCLLSAVGGDANVAFPSDLLYQMQDVHRYNLDIPVTPAAVTYPSTAEQVSAVVVCATKYGAKVQARSGGHGYGNYCLGGAGPSAIVVDTKNFQQFSMDRNSWIATVGAGTLLGDLDKRTHSNGERFISKGEVAQIGIGGHATIGGLGSMSRQFGTATDQVVEMQVVLANSSVVRATEAINSDLFFAMRGAGASFGIVTEFKFQTVPEPKEAIKYTYNITTGGAAALANTFKSWNRLVSDPKLSWKFSSVLTIFKGGLSITGTYYGSQAEFDALNLRSQLPGGVDLKVNLVSDVVIDLIQSTTKTGLDLFGGLSAHFYSKSLTFTPQTLLDDKTIDALFQYLERTDAGTLLWFVIFDLEGGYINTVPADKTAYPHRNVLYFLQSYAVSLVNTQQKTYSFLDGINEVVRNGVPDARGAYAGYVDPRLSDGQRQYWLGNLERLQTIKKQVDPQDVFSNPQSVKV